MNRRGFLKGTVSVMAMAAVLKFAPPKPEYIRKIYPVEGSNPRYAEALARSMYTRPPDRKVFYGPSSLTMLGLEL